LLTKKNQS